jgi:hypothetical protein
MNYSCPVCFFDRMPYPPRRYNICPCCGTEFDNDDVDHTFAELRYRWIENGAGWFFGQPPHGWSAAAQLAKAGFGVHTDVAAHTDRLNTISFRDVRAFELQLV